MLDTAYTLCKRQWHYQIPTAEQDRVLLQALCRQALEFENHFLELRRDYLLSELSCDDENRMLQAVDQLDKILYFDEIVIETLHDMNIRSDSALEEAINGVLSKIQHVNRDSMQ